jgi:hypothetical protein
MAQRVVRAADLKPPRSISALDFDDICFNFKIGRQQRDEVRNFLTDLVERFGAAIARDRSFPSREQDGLAIKKAINYLRGAEIVLKAKKGAPGLRALKLAGQHIAPAVADSWLQSRFPKEFIGLTELDPPADCNPLRLGPRDTDRLSERENRSLDHRIDFMFRHGGSALAKLLSDEIAALEKGLLSIYRLPPGRKPLTHRTYMLAALAEIWRRLGLRPTSGLSSRFGSFCEAVFEAIGWPTEGVKSALPDAIKLWRRLYR